MATVVESPWRFLGDLEIKDPTSMRQLMVIFHNATHPVSEAVDPREYGECTFNEDQKDRIRNMIAESENNKLLKDMLIWFGDHHSKNPRSLILAVQVLRSHATWYVRNPKMYKAEYAWSEENWKYFVVHGQSYIDYSRMRSDATYKEVSATVSEDIKGARTRRDGSMRSISSTIVKMEDSESEEPEPPSPPPKAIKRRKPVIDRSRYKRKTSKEQSAQSSNYKSLVKTSVQAKSVKRPFKQEPLSEDEADDEDDDGDIDVDAHGNDLEYQKPRKAKHNIFTETELPGPMKVTRSGKFFS